MTIHPISFDCTIMSLLRRTSWDKFAALRHFKFFFFLIEDVGNTSTIYLCSSHPGTTNVFFCATVLKAGGQSSSIGKNVVVF